MLHVLLALGILVMIVSPCMPTTDEPDAKIKIVLVVFFQVVVLLCILGVILLSATSLPHEIEDRTIYGILSKPVSRAKVVVGKIAGYATLSALLLVILGLLNVFTIQRIASGIPEGKKGVFKVKNEFDSSGFSIEGRVHHVREGIIWVEGGRSGVATWKFQDLNKKLDDKFSFEVECDLKIESGKGSSDTIPLVVGIGDPVVGQGKTEVLSAKMDEPLTVEIDRVIIQKSGSLVITVFPLCNDDYIGVTKEYVKVFSVQKGFVFNYAKAIVMTFLKFLLMVVIAVMGSTYLSAPVSIASALFVFLCGHILDFFRDFSLLVNRSDLHEHTLPSGFKTPNIFFVYLDYVAKKPLEVFSVIMPDFKKLDSLKYLLKGVNIPMETIGVLFVYTAIYVVVCLFISCVIFSRREFL